MSQSVVPDLFEPITGYREWNVHGQSPVLWSLVLSKRWPVHEPLLAEGRLDVGGIYAFNDTSELLGFEIFKERCGSGVVWKSTSTDTEPSMPTPNGCGRPRGMCLDCHE